MHDLHVDVVGALEDAFIFRGRRYFAHDVEHTVDQCIGTTEHAAVAAFVVNDVFVIAVECSDGSNALRMCIPIVSHVLEVHHAPIDVLVFLHPHTIPRDCHGEKQRFRMRDALAAGSVHPLFSIFAE